MLNAFRCMDEGVKPETMDAAMEAFGMPMGPIELADTVGLDICLPPARSSAQGRDASPAKLLTRARSALGQLGKKTGQGIYHWVDGKPVKGAAGRRTTSAWSTRWSSPTWTRRRRRSRKASSPTPTWSTPALIFGTGFAPFRGGPLHYLEEQVG